MLRANRYHNRSYPTKPNNFYPRFKPTGDSQLTAAERRELHGSITLRGLTADGNRVDTQHPIRSNGYIEKDSEAFLTDNLAFLRHAETFNWNDEVRFEFFLMTLDGEARRLADEILDQGYLDYDPANGQNNAQFLIFLDTFLCKLCQHDSPGDVCNTKTMEIQYKQQKVGDVLIPPRQYASRFEQIRRLNVNFPSTMPQLNAQLLIQQQFNGLPQEAQDYIQDDRRIDYLDLAGGGQEPYTVPDLFEVVQTWWNKDNRTKYEKVMQEMNRTNNKRKRNDDENTFEEEQESADNTDDDEENNTDDDDDDNDNDTDEENYDDDNENYDDDETKDNEDNDQQTGRNVRRRSNNNNRESSGGGGNFFKQPCAIHQGHLYEECPLCFTGNNFDRVAADAYYQDNASRNQQWWRRTYENKFPGQQQQQQQQQPQQQQSFYQQQQLHPQGGQYQGGQYVYVPQASALPSYQPVTLSYASLPAQQRQPVPSPRPQPFSVGRDQFGRAVYTLR